MSLIFYILLSHLNWKKKKTSDSYFSFVDNTQSVLPSVAIKDRKGVKKKTYQWPYIAYNYGFIATYKSTKLITFQPQ